VINPYSILVCTVDAERQKQFTSPTVSKYANKTQRNHNVFESLYGDALQRRENRKKKEEGTEGQ
jgi:hypothetical protein